MELKSKLNPAQIHDKIKLHLAQIELRRSFSSPPIPCGGDGAATLRACRGGEARSARHMNLRAAPRRERTLMQGKKKKTHSGCSGYQTNFLLSPAHPWGLQDCSSSYWPRRPSQVPPCRPLGQVAQVTKPALGQFGIPPSPGLPHPPSRPRPLYPPPRPPPLRVQPFAVHGRRPRRPLCRNAPTAAGSFRSLPPCSLTSSGIRIRPPSCIQELVSQPNKSFSLYRNREAPFFPRLSPADAGDGQAEAARWGW